LATSSSELFFMHGKLESKYTTIFRKT